MHYIKKHTGLLTFTCTVLTDSLEIDSVTGFVGSWLSSAYSSRLPKHLNVAQTARTCNLADPELGVSSASH